MNNHTKQTSDREKYLIAQALWEWQKNELERPQRERRESDAVEIREFVEAQYPDELAMIEVTERAKAELEL